MMRCVRRNTFLFALGVLLSAGSAFADDTGKAKTAASYLWLSHGARAAGMGGAFTALADDANGAFYNPAAIAQSVRHELGFTSAVLGADRSYGAFSYVFAFEKAVKQDDFARFERRQSSGFFAPPDDRIIGLGFTWLNLGVSGIDGRDDLGNATGSLSDNENTYILSAGYNQTENLYLGMNFKMHAQSLAGATANGIGFDVGALYRFPDRPLSLGLAIQNISDSLKWKVRDSALNITDQYTETVRLRTKLGAAYRVSDRLLTALDLDFTSQQALGYNIGAEYRLSTPFVLRAGMDDLNPSFGFGLTVLESTVHVALDYAYIIDINALSNQHRFTLQARFGEAKKKKALAKKVKKEKLEKVSGTGIRSITKSKTTTKVKTAAKKKAKTKKKVKKRADETLWYFK